MTNQTWTHQPRHHHQTIMMLDNEQMNTLPLEFVAQKLVRQGELDTKQKEVKEFTCIV